MSDDPVGSPEQYRCSRKRNSRLTHGSAWPAERVQQGQAKQHLQGNGLVLVDDGGRVRRSSRRGGMPSVPPTGWLDGQERCRSRRPKRSDGMRRWWGPCLTVSNGPR
jgi:hypothetical protein